MEITRISELDDIVQSGYHVSGSDFFPIDDASSLVTYRVSVYDFLANNASYSISSSISSLSGYAITSSNSLNNVSASYNLSSYYSISGSKYNSASYVTSASRSIRSGFSDNSLTGSFLKYNGFFNGSASYSISSSITTYAASLINHLENGIQYAMTRWNSNIKLVPSDKFMVLPSIEGSTTINSLVPTECGDSILQSTQITNNLSKISIGFDNIPILSQCDTKAIIAKGQYNNGVGAIVGTGPQDILRLIGDWDNSVINTTTCPEFTASNLPAQGNRLVGGVQKGSGPAIRFCNYSPVSGYPNGYPNTGQYNLGMIRAVDDNAAWGGGLIISTCPDINSSEAVIKGTNWWKSNIIGHGTGVAAYGTTTVGGTPLYDRFFITSRGQIIMGDLQRPADYNENYTVQILKNSRNQTNGALYVDGSTLLNSLTGSRTYFDQQVYVRGNTNKTNRGYTGIIKYKSKDDNIISLNVVEGIVVNSETINTVDPVVPIDPDYNVEVTVDNKDWGGVTGANKYYKNADVTVTAYPRTAVEFGSAVDVVVIYETFEDSVPETGIIPWMTSSNFSLFTAFENELQAKGFGTGYNKNRYSLVRFGSAKDVTYAPSFVYYDSSRNNLDVTFASSYGCEAWMSYNTNSLYSIGYNTYVYKDSLPSLSARTGYPPTIPAGSMLTSNWPPPKYSSQFYYNKPENIFLMEAKYENDVNTFLSPLITDNWMGMTASALINLPVEVSFAFGSGQPDDYGYNWEYSEYGSYSNSKMGAIDAYDAIYYSLTKLESSWRTDDLVKKVFIVITDKGRMSEIYHEGNSKYDHINNIKQHLIDNNVILIFMVNNNIHNDSNENAFGLNYDGTWYSSSNSSGSGGTITTDYDTSKESYENIKQYYSDMTIGSDIKGMIWDINFLSSSNTANISEFKHSFISQSTKKIADKYSYVFDGWYKDSILRTDAAKITGSNPYTFNITEDTKMWAYFVQSS